MMQNLPHEPADIFEIIQRIIREHTRQKKNITPETHFQDDLDLGPLGIMFIIVDCEKAFNVNISDVFPKDVTHVSSLLKIINDLTAVSAA